VIQNLAAEFSVQALCLALEVSRSGFYRWSQCYESPRAKANRDLLQQIQRVHAESRLTYGSPRITQQLLREKVPCSENRVARLMRQQGLCARKKRPFRPRTTQGRHAEPIAPNRLQAVLPTRPDQAWVADITYVWTVAVGFIWPPSWISTGAKSLAGQSEHPWKHPW
jgi:putative transposase